MSRRLPCAALLLASAAFLTEAHAIEPAPTPAKVMIMGVFHFANPGRDVV
ncbi:MAG TPA: hypothetical protein VLK29_04985 [Luteimonas sp.]|nr:hypothetical protein [Luteimonas sp.]